MHRVIFLSLLLSCLPSIVACDSDKSTDKNNDATAEVSNKQDTAAADTDNNKDKSDEGSKKDTESSEKKTDGDDAPIDLSAISALVEDATNSDNKDANSEKDKEIKAAEEHQLKALKELDGAASDAEMSVGDMRDSISAIVGDAMKEEGDKK